ncbi:MAG: M55 family metallopeptidase, partial [Sulfolobales archaeon]
MKAYVSVDLEGMPFIVSGEHLFVKGSLYNEARRIATRITLVVAETLHEEGFEEIIIADSHGPMINLEVEDLPEYIVMIRGSLRPLSMVVGVERADIALFLGY